MLLVSALYRNQHLFAGHAQPTEEFLSLETDLNEYGQTLRPFKLEDIDQHKNRKFIRDSKRRG
jgi:hypothetical protein